MKRVIKPVTRPIVLTALVGAALLAGCGQKGPLVLPGYPKEAVWPYPPRPAPASKPETPQRKAPDVPATSDSTK